MPSSATEEKTLTATAGGRLRRYREALGVTQAWLGEESGVNKASIHRWESGGAELNPYWPRHRDAVEAIARVLGIPPSAIWDDPEVSPPATSAAVPFGGSVPCEVSEYAGTLHQPAGEVSPVRRSRLGILPEEVPDVDEIVLTAGAALAPRANHGSVVGVRRTRTPISGYLHLVSHGDVVGIYGLSDEEGWWMEMVGDGKRVPMEGEVLGRVVYLESRVGKTVLRESDPVGLPTIHPLRED